MNLDKVHCGGNAVNVVLTGSHGNLDPAALEQALTL